jgi:hypothetical protein
MAETDVVVRITQSIIRIPIGKTGIGTIIPIATDQKRQPNKPAQRTMNPFILIFN